MVAVSWLVRGRGVKQKVVMQEDVVPSSLHRLIIISAAALRPALLPLQLLPLQLLPLQPPASHHTVPLAPALCRAQGTGWKSVFQCCDWITRKENVVVLLVRQMLLLSTLSWLHSCDE